MLLRCHSAGCALLLVCLLQQLLAGMRDSGATAAVVECTAAGIAGGSTDWIDPTIVVYTNLGDNPGDMQLFGSKQVGAKQHCCMPLPVPFWLPLQRGMLSLCCSVCANVLLRMFKPPVLLLGRPTMHASTQPPYAPYSRIAAPGKQHRPHTPA